MANTSFDISNETFVLIYAVLIINPIIICPSDNVDLIFLNRGIFFLVISTKCIIHFAQT